MESESLLVDPEHGRAEVSDALVRSAHSGGKAMVFDHIGFNVTDFPKAKDFLLQALKPLGVGITAEGEGWAMVGRKGEGQLWFGSFGGSPGPIHIAFAAKTREEVRQFYVAALVAGERITAPPGCGLTITPTTTVRLSSAPMDTTWKPFATPQRPST